MLRTFQQHFLGTAVAAMLFTTIAIEPAIGAQTQTNPAASQATDAQMTATVQALLLQSQTPGAKPLTAAQMQLLMQYMLRQNQAAMLAGSQMSAQSQTMAAPGQMMRQPASSQGRYPGTPGQSSLGAKKPGVPRIGVVQARAQMGQGNSGANVAEPLRQTMIQYLSGPQLEVTPLDAMIPSQIEAEARQKECDYILYLSVSQKTSSGGMGFLKKAGPLASMVPMVGMIGSAGAIAGMAASTAVSGAAGVASSVKAKSEVTLDYKLMALGNTTAVVANTLKAKAKEDGEDVITPLIEQADTTILERLTNQQ